MEDPFTLHKKDLSRLFDRVYRTKSGEDCADLTKKINFIINNVYSEGVDLTLISEFNRQFNAQLNKVKSLGDLKQSINYLEKRFDQKNHPDNRPSINYNSYRACRDNGQQHVEIMANFKVNSPRQLSGYSSRYSANKKRVSRL